MTGTVTAAGSSISVLRILDLLVIRVNRGAFFRSSHVSGLPILSKVLSDCHTRR